MENPLVTVITPTYNRANLIGRTIQSIIDQTYDNIEHIIVNDGGEDISKVIKGISKNNYKKAKRIKYINKKEHEGVSATRNVALKEAKGDYICLLDDDDIYLPLAIEFRLWAMEKFGAEIVYTRALKDIWDVKNGVYVSVKKELYWECPFNKDLILIQNVAHSPCVLFSRTAWDNSGNYMYDTTLETGEDYDFWIALSRNTDFYNLQIIDAESTIRPADKTQATGKKDFSISYPIIYKRWRDTAINKNWVIENQNRVLTNIGKNPEDYGL